ncbi:hypothetical protein L9F63_022512, partial [Diploptera punctata]
MQRIQETEPRPKKGFRSQIFISIASWLIGTSYGMSMGHSAVLLPHLRAENGSLYIEEETGSWIASVYAFAAPIGCLVAGVTMDIWGRWKMNIIGDLGMIVGWILIIFAENIPMLIVGRVLEGFSRSILATAIMVLLDEVAEPRYRGFIVCSVYTCVSIGIMAISSLGALLHWRIASALACLVSIVTLLAIWVITESPTWYVRMNRVQEADKALQWLWGPKKANQAKEELYDLKRRFHPCNSEEEILSKGVVQERNLKKYLEPRILKPFFIMHVFNGLQAVCGLGILTFYTVDIVSKTRNGDIEVLDDYSSTVVISVVRVIFVLVSSFLMLSLGRRTIAMISGTSSTISAISLGVILLLREMGSPIHPYTESYILFILLLIYAGSMSFGFFSLPTIMIGETQPTHVRGFACGYFYTMNDLFLGGVVKLYPWISNTLKIQGLFFMFGISCLVCTVFVYLFLPETQGLTLSQIEDYFRKDNVLWITRHKGSQISVYSIAGPIGCLFGGLGSDLWGRRTLNVVGATGTMIGWILITFSQNAAMLVWGRVFEGFSRSTTASALT